MAYSIKVKEKALSLRSKGYSINEIYDETGVSRGRISEWVRDVILSQGAKSRLSGKLKLGQIKVAERKKQETREKINYFLEESIKEVGKIPNNESLSRIFCSLIYWCEGVKSQYSCMCFTNSDPMLVKAFLNLLRKSFKIDNSKFRVCVHLHNYHNQKNQLKFWSGVTDIPLRQFIRPFIKENTGKRVRKGYNGCVSVRYYDITVARWLLATAKAFLSKHESAVKIRA